MPKLFSLIIVDDESSIACGLRDLYPWQEWGFYVSGIFNSADAALLHLAAEGADVVLSDIRMPGTDGLSFARIINETYPQTRTVLLSAYSDFEYARQAMRYGVSNYLVKPIRYDRLTSVFSTLRTELMAKQQSSSDKPAHSESAHAYHNEIIEYIYRYVNGNLATANLTEAASNLGYTQGYISRIFKNTTGETFSEYLTAQRMIRAAKLLCGPYASLRDVALWVGYENAQHFSHAFSRHFGVSPQQYASRTGKAHPAQEE